MNEKRAGSSELARFVLLRTYTWFVLESSGHIRTQNKIHPSGPISHPTICFLRPIHKYINISIPFCIVAIFTARNAVVFVMANIIVNTINTIFLGGILFSIIATISKYNRHENSFLQPGIIQYLIEARRIFIVDLPVSLGNWQ